MKRFIAVVMLVVLCLSLCLGVGISAANASEFSESNVNFLPKAETVSNPIYFNDIFTYNGKVYATDQLRISGWNKVPSEAYTFAIYDGYIYYLKNPDGTGVIATSLYRCKLDGSNKKLLTSKISPWNSTPFIVNNTIFYDGGDDDTEAYDGVFTLNLATLKIKRFLSSDCTLAYSSADYVYFYYQYNSLYRIKFNGSGKTRIPSVKNPSVLYENYIYYVNDGYMYKELSDGTKKSEKLDVQMDDDWSSFNVTNDRIFCNYDKAIYGYKLDGSDKKLLTSLEKNVYFAYGFTVIGNMLYFVENGDIIQSGNQIYTDFFYRVPITGGKKEYLNKRWFTS